jgi:hypothetical protein
MDSYHIWILDEHYSELLKRLAKVIERGVESWRQDGPSGGALAIDMTCSNVFRAGAIQICLGASANPSAIVEANPKYVIIVNHELLHDTPSAFQRLLAKYPAWDCNLANMTYRTHELKIDAPCGILKSSVHSSSSLSSSLQMSQDLEAFLRDAANIQVPCPIATIADFYNHYRNQPQYANNMYFPLAIDKRDYLSLNPDIVEFYQDKVDEVIVATHFYTYGFQEDRAYGLNTTDAESEEWSAMTMSPPGTDKPLHHAPRADELDYSLEMGQLEVFMKLSSENDWTALLQNPPSARYQPQSMPIQFVTSAHSNNYLCLVLCNRWVLQYPKNEHARVIEDLKRTRNMVLNEALSGRHWFGSLLRRPALDQRPKKGPTKVIVTNVVETAASKQQLVKQPKKSQRRDSLVPQNIILDVQNENDCSVTGAKSSESD